MKKIQLFGIAILFTALLQAQSNQTQQAVQQTVTKLFDALSNRDSVSLKQYCADDISLYEYGMAWNLDTLINRAITLNTATDFKRIDTLDFINTTIDKNVAWTTYNLSSEITKDGKQTSVKWLETVIVVNERNKWKVKVLHSSLIKRN
ncbi:nuclear transport factor 2 family protein [Ferruginibacter paludis]|uniref:nuclear transport factor 2 family protein n=1 Tax=Ferruginibacter paludis TaxID=1310417 RepID=UPI0025B44D9F|nr:nuclear transport factor 2 family protein [Ferruginibacter paludis]MDN3657027.1 nuclear transport factor 2 family protein [Ferruginibacter paludis]